MKRQMLTIPVNLPGLNELIASMNRNRYSGNKAKSGADDTVMWAIKAAGIKPVEGKAHFAIRWYCPNRRSDPDNIISAKKYILDGMRKSGVIRNDGWSDLYMPTPFMEGIYIDRKNPRIEIEIFDLAEGEQPYE